MGLRVSIEVLLRTTTKASTVRQYPSQRGKKAQCVRRPANDQFRVQKAPTKASPSHPWGGQRHRVDSLTFT